MKTCLSFLLLFLTVAELRAEIVYPSTTATERILNKVATVNQYLTSLNASSSVDDKINQLDYSGIREQLTELQNLIRVYQDMKCCKTLKPFYEESKKFEDLISHVRDYKYFYQDADNEISKQKYKEILDREVTIYTDFFQNSSWFKTDDQSFSKTLESLLKTLDLPTQAEERNQALAVLAHRLEQIHKKSFDLSKIELGVHEFKRDVRRFSYLRRGYTDLITTDYDSCPASLEEIKAKEVTQYSCAVSSCLTYKLDSAASQLDSIKMDGLQYELRGEIAPKEITDRAQTIHDDIKGSQVLLMIAEQLKQCQTKPLSKSKKETL